MNNSKLFIIYQTESRETKLDVSF